MGQVNFSLDKYIGHSLFSGQVENFAIPTSLLLGITESVCLGPAIPRELCDDVSSNL